MSEFLLDTDCSRGLVGVPLGMTFLRRAKCSLTEYCFENELKVQARRTTAAADAVEALRTNPNFATSSPSVGLNSRDGDESIRDLLKYPPTERDIDVLATNDYDLLVSQTISEIPVRSPTLCLIHSYHNLRGEAVMDDVYAQTLDMIAAAGWGRRADGTPVPVDQLKNKYFAVVPDSYLRERQLGEDIRTTCH